LSVEKNDQGILSLICLLVNFNLIANHNLIMISRGF
jgi:hypothetical protein